MKSSAPPPTDLRGLVRVEASVSPRVLQLLLQPPTLCPPLAHGLLGPGLQFIPGPHALLEQRLRLLLLCLPSALEKERRK